MQGDKTGSSFENYQPPQTVHDGPPCILHEPSVVLRATVRLQSLPMERRHSQGMDMYRSAGGKFDTRYPGIMMGGRFRFLECIAEGVSAVVITAEDTFRPACDVVVIKVMHQKYRECALQEARLLRFLNAKDLHDACHVIRLRSLFEFHGHVCLVMDQMHGSLLDYLGLEASLGRSNVALLSDLRKIAHQLLTSLAFLRAAGLTHADLKLENVLMVRPCTAVAGNTRARGWGSVGVKLADFGNAFSELNHDEEDFDIQTLSYRAPEVLLGARPLTPAIDMWSLGCILAELALRRLLFAAQTPSQLLQQMAAALGGIPPRALFGDGRLYTRVCREAGFALGWRAKKAQKRAGEKCHFAEGGLPGVAVAEGGGAVPGHFGWGGDGNRLANGLRKGAERYRGMGVQSKLGAALRAIDPPLADLVCRLLAYDPALRPTPEEAIEHPFFRPLNPSHAIRQAFPLAGGLPSSNEGDPQARPRLGEDRRAKGLVLERNGSPEANGVNRGLQCGTIASGLVVAREEPTGKEDRASRKHFADAAVDGLSQKPHFDPAPVEKPSLRDLRSEPGATVSKVAAADVTRGAQKGSGPLLASAPATAPEIERNTLRGPDRIPAHLRAVVDSEKVSAAQLKSTPLKSVHDRGGSEALLGRAKVPPFCSTAWSFGGQVAASFESSKAADASPLQEAVRSEGVAHSSRFAINVLEGWKGRQGVGSLPVSVPVEAMGLQQLVERHEDVRHLRPVAIHTRGQASEREGVNTPGEVSFAASLVARQGTDPRRRGVNTLLHRDELDRERESEEDAGLTALGVKEPTGVKEPVIAGKNPKGAGETANITGQIEAGPSLVGLSLRPGELFHIQRRTEGPSAAAKTDTCLRTCGLPPEEPARATAAKGAADRLVAQTGNHTNLSPRAKSVASSRVVLNEDARRSLQGQTGVSPILGGGFPSSAPETGAGWTKQQQPVKGDVAERPMSGPPDSDSCGSAVLSSPPSGENRLNAVDTVCEEGSKGEVVSLSKRGCIAMGGSGPAASELSLTAPPFRVTRGKRKRETDSLTKVPGRQGGFVEREQEKRTLRREGVVIVEDCDGGKVGARKRSAGRLQEGRDETPPLQQERVLPKRPAREERKPVSWWIAVPRVQLAKSE